MGNSLSYQEVYDTFKSKNCKLLTKEYRHNMQKLQYICSCGDMCETTLNVFKRSKTGCKKCGYEHGKIDMKTVEKCFTDRGCTLLTKKINLIGKDKLKYICHCGNTHEMLYFNFKNGHDCPNCYIEKIKRTQIKNGNASRIEDRESYEIYKSRVINNSNVTYKKFKHIINPNDLLRGKRNYHVDHKFSILNGFINRVPIFIMSSVLNLQMLYYIDNQRKKVTNDITLTQLYEEFYDK